jgi:hypothetical protein
MFRNSDYVPPKLHPSYILKPKPEMQLRSEISQFDESAISAHRRQQDMEYSAPIEPPVPATYDTVYDPSHPASDWGVRMCFLIKRTVS